MAGTAKLLSGCEGRTCAVGVLNAGSSSAAELWKLMSVSERSVEQEGCPDGGCRSALGVFLTDSVITSAPESAHAAYGILLTMRVLYTSNLKDHEKPAGGKKVMSCVFDQDVET